MADKTYTSSSAIIIFLSGSSLTNVIFNLHVTIKLNLVLRSITLQDKSVIQPF